MRFSKSDFLTVGKYLANGYLLANLTAIVLLSTYFISFTDNLSNSKPWISYYNNHLNQSNFIRAGKAVNFKENLNIQIDNNSVILTNDNKIKFNAQNITSHFAKSLNNIISLQTDESIVFNQNKLSQKTFVNFGTALTKQSNSSILNISIDGNTVKLNPNNQLYVETAPIFRILDNSIQTFQTNDKAIDFRTLSPNSIYAKNLNQNLTGIGLFQQTNNAIAISIDGINLSLKNFSQVQISDQAVGFQHLKDEILLNFTTQQNLNRIFNSTQANAISLQKSSNSTERRLNRYQNRTANLAIDVRSPYKSGKGTNITNQTVSINAQRPYFYFDNSKTLKFDSSLFLRYDTFPISSYFTKPWKTNRYVGTEYVTIYRRDGRTIDNSIDYFASGHFTGSAGWSGDLTILLNKDCYFQDALELQFDPPYFLKVYSTTPIGIQVSFNFPVTTRFPSEDGTKYNRPLFTNTLYPIQNNAYIVRMTIMSDVVIPAGSYPGKYHFL